MNDKFKGQQLTSCQFSCLCYPLDLKHASSIWKIVIPMEDNGDGPNYWYHFVLIKGASLFRFLFRHVYPPDVFLRSIDDYAQDNYCCGEEIDQDFFNPTDAE